MTGIFYQNLRQLMAILLFSLLCHSAKAQTGPDPFATYLQSIPAPVFNPTNQLKPLTFCGENWQMSNSMVVLGTKYGYTAYFAYVAYDATTPGTMAYGLTQLAKTNANFKVSTTVIQNPILSYLPTIYATNNPVTGTWWGKGYYCTNSAGLYLESDGTPTTNAALGVMSPCADIAELQRWTDCQILSIKQFNSNCPISVIENDGEWGLPDYSSDYNAYWQDVRYTNVMAGLGITNSAQALNDPRVFEYQSQQKARQINLLADAVRTNFPGVFYFFYNTCQEKFRTVSPFSTVWATLDGMNTRYGWDSAFVATNLTYPTSEIYYKNSNNGMSNVLGGSPLGMPDSTFGASLLFQQQNWKAWNISQGKPLSYDYTTSGWIYHWGKTNQSGNLYDDGHYTGFLKCLYAMGTIGGNMGWYGDDGSVAGTQDRSIYNAPFSTTNVPPWMSQMILLSRVHAQFSWLSDYLYAGSLLAGPYRHALSFDLNSYDWAPEVYNGSVNLPGGYLPTNTAHVFIRKLNASNNWLLTAWTSAANNESVTVTNIPTLGTVTLNARTNGAVYLATPTTLTLQDTNGDFPTEWRNQVSPPTNLRLLK